MVEASPVNLTDEQLGNLIKENSFLISPLAQNNWFERCFAFEAQRMVDTQKLHNMLFDPSQIKDLENKELVTLYTTLIKDQQFQKTSNMKIVEMKENNRMISALSKAYAEQESRRQIAQSEQSHIDTMIQDLLDQSLRHAMDDQINKQIGGSNSYRPLENKNFDIVIKDKNADE